MKWVKRVMLAVAVLVVGAAAVLGAMGLRSGANQFTEVTEFGRPPQEVYAWLTEPDKVKQWVSWLVEIRRESPTREVWVMEDANNGNQKMSIVNEAVEQNPPQFLKVKLSAPEAFTGASTYRLTDLGSGRTRLAYTMEYQFDSWFARLLEPVITRSAAEKMRGDLERLRGKMEGKNGRT